MLLKTINQQISETKLNWRFSQLWYIIMIHQFFVQINNTVQFADKCFFFSLQYEEFYLTNSVSLFSKYIQFYRVYEDIYCFALTLENF